MYLPKLASVPVLAPTVEELELGMNEKLVDISAVRGLSKLVRLDLYGSKNVASVSAVKNLKELRKLSFYGLGKPTDFSAIAGLTKV